MIMGELSPYPTFKMWDVAHQICHYLFPFFII